MRERGPALLAWRGRQVAITSTDHSIVLAPSSGATGTGLVFVPGAKVDPGDGIATISSATARAEITGALASILVGE